MPAIHRLPRALALGAALVLSVACGDDSTAPAPGPSVQIAPLAGAVYPSDVVTLQGTVRTATGAPVPGATIEWSVSDASVAELGTGGILTALKPGVVRVTAAHGAARATRELTVRPLTVLQVTILPGVVRLARGDISPVGVRVQGEGGRDVPGRAVTLSVDDSAIATIDASGRVRAVTSGVTTLRATAAGVTGTARLEVGVQDVQLFLTRQNGSRLPLLVAADSVWVDGVLEYHEVYLESGTLALSGSAQPRYEVKIGYAEYHVYTVGGTRRMDFLRTQREYDRGLVTFDARGDLAMTSEYISPLSHTATPLSGGMQMSFRIPGDTTRLDLFFRREPL